MADLPKTMHAVVLTRPGKWELQEVPAPQPEGTDVVCRVDSVAICGTDPNIIKGAFPGMWPSHYPFIIGHEWAGEVVAIAPEAATSPAIAKRFAVGTRVAGEAHCGCGICANCLVGDYTICLNYGDNALGHHHYGFTTQGAYATYIKTSVKSIHPLPGVLSYEEAAMLDMAGVALNGVHRSGVKVGDAVCVAGPGPAGNMTLQLCKAAGAKKVIMVGRGARLQSSSSRSSPRGLRKDGGRGQGCVGSDRRPGRGRGVRMRRDQGVLHQVAAHGPQRGQAGHDRPGQGADTDRMEQAHSRPGEFHRRAGQPEHIRCRSRHAGRRTWDGKALHTHSFPLEQFGEALATFTEKRDGAMKVVLKP